LDMCMGRIQQNEPDNKSPFGHRFHQQMKPKLEVNGHKNYKDLNSLLSELEALADLTDTNEENKRRDKKSAQDSKQVAIVAKKPDAGGKKKDVVPAKKTSQDDATQPTQCPLHPSKVFSHVLADCNTMAQALKTGDLAAIQKRLQQSSHGDRKDSNPR